MAIGDHIPDGQSQVRMTVTRQHHEHVTYIPKTKPMEEYHIMSPPRRPKGEKPAIAIQFLNRQIANMQASLNLYHGQIAERNKQINRQNVELSEAADRERLLMGKVESAGYDYGKLLASHQRRAIRLSFLEGYYHAKTETLPHDPAKTYRGSGAGNQENLPDGAQDQKEEGLEALEVRLGCGPRSKIRGFLPGDTAHSDRRPVAEREIGEYADELYRAGRDTR